MMSVYNKFFSASKIYGTIFILFIFVAPVFSADNVTEVPPSALSGQEKLVDPQALLKDLREREQTLNTREADLNARETRLKTIEQNLSVRENELKQMRQDVTDRLKELDVKNDEELNKLAKIYASTKPKSAAVIFIEMDIDKALSIFRRMNPSAAGKILNEMGRINPAFASKLSEGLTPQPVFDQK